MAGGAFPACSVIGVGNRDESDPLLSFPSYLAQGLKGGPSDQLTIATGAGTEVLWDWGWVTKSSVELRAGSRWTQEASCLFSREENLGVRKAYIGQRLLTHLLLGTSPMTDR